MSDETIKKPPKSDCSYTDELTCPYCGYEDRDSWECREDDGEATCGHCEKDYSYIRNVEVTYTTTEICTCEHAIGYHEYPDKTCHHNDVKYTIKDDVPEPIYTKCKCEEFKSIA